MEVKDQIRVKIIGAGSIGNHLCFAARSLNWEVVVTDISPDALLRMKSIIYPSRYGKWDDKVKFLNAREDELANEKQHYDLVFVCTPPGSHLKVATDQLIKHEPKFLFIEKPLSSPGLGLELRNLKNLSRKTETKILVGYNHRLTPNTQYLLEKIRNNNYGQIKFLRSNFRENWKGILNAHPWLDGPGASYLGYIKSGGGSLFEHSHGLDLLLYAAETAKLGRPSILSSVFTRINDGNLDYDENVIGIFEFDNQIVGIFEQNVFTNPAVKKLEIEFEDATVKWFTLDKKAGVEIYSSNGELLDSFIYDKERKDDFAPQIEHLEKLIKGDITRSPIALDQIEVTQAVLEDFFSNYQIKNVQQ